MPILTVLIDPILPVFAILAFGFFLGRTGRMSLEAARTINRFAMTVLIPIVIFDLLAHAPFDEFAAAPVALYLAVQALVFAATFLAARRFFAVGASEAVILGYAGVFANNVFYALPIGVLLYGEDGVLPMTMVVVLDATVSFGGTMLALQALETGRVSPRSVLRMFARTPALVAIFAGLAVGVVGLPVPGPVETFLDFNGAAAAPVALFALGVVLSATRFQADPAVATVVAVKLLIFPAVIAAGMVLLPGGWEANERFVFASAGPVGAMAFSLAILHGVPTERVAQAMVWTCALTLFTLAALA